MAINVGELFAVIGLRDTMSPELRRAVNNLRRAASSFREQTQAVAGHATRMGGTVSRSLASATSTAVRSLTRLGTALTVTAAKFALLEAASATVTSSVVSLGAALAPAVGIVAALPGAVGLFAGALATLKVALLGVGDAFEAALGDDEEKFAEAIANLAPAAQAAAVELRELFPLLRGIQLMVQESLFEPLVGQLTAVANVLGYPLMAGMSGVASATAQAAVQVAQFARSAEAVNTVNTVFASLRQIVLDLSPAITPLLTGLARITQVGAQFTATLAPAVAQLAIRVGQFMQEAADSGRAWGWMQGAVQVFVQLIAIGREFAGILSGVFSAMRAAGGDALGVLGSVLSALNQAVNSAQGQQALVSVFLAIRAAAVALAPAILAIAIGVGQLAPILATLAIQIGPILTAAVLALTPALVALGPGLVAVFGALGQAVAVLGPALLPVAQAFSALLVAATPLIGLLSRIIATLGTALADGVQRVLPYLNQLAGALIAGWQALQPVVPLLVDLAVTVISQLVPAFAPLIPQVATLVTSLVTGLLPAVQPLIPVIAQVAQQIGIVLLTALTNMQPQLFELVTQLGALLIAVLPLLPPLLELVVAILPPLIQLVGGLAQLLRGDLNNAIGTIAEAIGRLLVAVGELGWHLLVGLWNGIQSAAAWFGERIYNFFRNIMPDWVRQALGINSPSTVFAQIGDFSMQGMAQGMQAGSRRVLATAADIASRLASSFRPELKADLGVQGSSPALGTTGQTVTGRSRAGGAVIHVTAINPVAEPTSETVNRGLQVAGLMGVI